MDKRDRKQKLDAWRNQQREAAREEMPMSQSDLESLFEALDAALSDGSCDHTLRYTLAWLAEHGKDQMVVVPWLREHGGFCDCEVLANVEDHVEEAFRGGA